METWAADSLATSLCQSFPRSNITADIWATEFGDLNQAQAEEAVRRIRRTFEHAPTIAAFHNMYASLALAPDPGELCEHCAGTGMVTDTDHPRHWPGTPGTLPALYELDRLQGRCNCNVVTWCRQCAQGEHARGLLRSMTTTPNAR